MKYASAGLVIAFLASSCEPLPPNRNQRPYRTAAERERERYERDDRPDGYNDRRDGYQDQTDGYQPNPEPPPTRDTYPTAERTANPNQVISPYKPYNVIDVEGFRSGQLAKDPSNGKIFRVP
ncbi:MAG: hypothetical protein NWT08_10855 [Akkermansiaceae bacterium]|jgi:hypothetical protein|nr:hypothetical protein [Akkermansiaceae bacterium]MDP4722430.1 hypothetical protein [Akkermansiaceae bacterium]MDP4781165.1 hypothetical protein [Akkermansiaceae bacterium]MDP4846513.1 hypothetical protein [Akkermansiaceae bacterium]MDP4898470.1 hypothetical protein [Akkermansiaceae bacterium]